MLCVPAGMGGGPSPGEETVALSSKITRAFTLWPSSSTNRSLQNTLAKNVKKHAQGYSLQHV